ncbi:MAG: MFS transporter [Novosphingobium sp.]|nr:MFS transporter [Novosphingobium sp.]
MTYFREFRRNWPNLLGAALGLGFGVAINFHMTNLFGPPLLAEFGWTKSQFALIGSLGLVSLFFTPVAGRIADRYGPRIAAMIGFSVVPAAFFAFSLMTGNIYQFYAIALVNGTLGVLTATMVFTRVVVERFDTARGLALSFLLCCPPLVAAVAAPIIGSIIEVEGWRAAYRTLALASACGGLAAILLIGKNHTSPSPSSSAPSRAPGMNWSQFRQLAREPVFLLLLGGMFLCNFPQIIVASQMNIMLMENGASVRFATAAVSLYSICVVIGRFISGYALDRMPAHLVAVIALGLPAIGFISLASTFDARWILGGSIALIGLAQGAETDVGAFLTSRRFDLGHYSFVFSMLMTAMGLASALGALLLSYMLHLTDSYDGFLYVAAGMTLSGALAFYLTGRHDKVELAAVPGDAALAASD